MHLLEQLFGPNLLEVKAGNFTRRKRIVRLHHPWFVVRVCPIYDDGVKLAVIAKLLFNGGLLLGHKSMEEAVIHEVLCVDP